MTTNLQPATRRVRQLRLRSPTRELADHTAMVLEDALRVASLPAAESGRLILIRRLDLGRIPATAGSVSLALHIEARCRDAFARSTSEPAGTASALAVTFPSRGEAIAALARELAHGSAGGEWFWPLAVPGWRPASPRPRAWRTLLRAALAEPAAPLVAGEMVHAAASAGRLTELAEAITTMDIPALYTACHWEPPPDPTAPGPSDPSGAEGERPPMPPDRAGSLAWFTPAIRDLIPGLRRQPRPLAAWFLAVLAVRFRPSLAGETSLPMLASRCLAARPASAPLARHVPPASAPAVETLSAAAQGQALRRANPVHTAEFRSVASGSTPARPEHPPPSLNPVPDDRPVAAPVPPDRVRPSGEFTAGGGLLFVVPVLTRLGFPAWLSEQAGLVGEDFGAHLLLTIGRRVGLKPDDALARALACRPEPQAPGLERADAPVCGPDVNRIAGQEAGTAGVGPEPVQRLDSVEAVKARSEWIRAVRRWCRLEAHLGLVSLIRRPARVRVSRTHLELFFELAETDLRIRRTGLDLDPGWVPWLGWVIQFHYLDSPDADADADAA